MNSPTQALAPFAHWRSWLPRALFESVLIVLSVLLALALDEWRRGRQQRIDLSLAVQGIRAELTDNKAEAERAYSRHVTIRDTLQAYARRADLPPARIYYGGMFNPASLLSIAWESARDGGSTEHLPYDVRLMLARVYDRQSRYRTLGDAIAQSIMSDVQRRGGETVFRDGYANFILLTEDFANRERRLVVAFDSALSVLGRSAR